MDKKRYEKEIEEILAKYDQETGRKEKPKADAPTNIGGAGGGFRPSAPNRSNASRRSKQPTFGSSLRNIGAGQYMVSAFVLAILAIFVRAFSPGLAGVMVLLAAALFLMPILFHRSPGGSSPQGEKRWRGQVIDFSTRREVTNDPLAAIKRWFRRR